MSRPAFEPMGFVDYLLSTDEYRIANDQFFNWSGTHWTPMTNRECERKALTWICEDGNATANATNAKQACATAMLCLADLRAPAHLPIIPVMNGYVHLSGSGAVLKPHNKALGLRHVIKCEYDPKAAAPVAFESSWRASCLMQLSERAFRSTSAIRCSLMPPPDCAVLAGLGREREGSAR